MERANLDKSPLKAANLPIVWVLGGPGCGKGTQCDKIVAKERAQLEKTGSVSDWSLKN